MTISHAARTVRAGRVLAAALAGSVAGLLAAPAQAERPDVLWNRAGHAAQVLNAKLTAAGDRLVSSSFDGTVKVWDVDSGDMLYSLPRYGPTALSPDDERFALQTLPFQGGALEVHDLSDGALRQSLPGGSFYAPAWSPDGTRLASVDGHAVRVWDLASGAAVLTLSGHTSAVRCIAWSPDGAFLVTGAGETNGNDNSARLWSAATGQQLHVLTGHSAYVFSVAVSPDSQLIATGAGDNTIRIWHAATGSLLRTLTGPSWPITSLAFSPDGQTLVSSDIGGPLRRWDVSTGVATVVGDGGAVGARSVTISADGGTIVAGSYFGQIDLYDGATGDFIRPFNRSFDAFGGLCYADDGRTLAYGGETTAIRVRARDGLFLDERDLGGHLNDQGIVFSPDLAIGVTLSELQNGPKLIDLGTGAELHTLLGHVSIIYEATFSPSGDYFVTAGEYQAGIWDARSGAFLRWYLNETIHTVHAVHVAGDETLIAYGDREMVKVFDLQTAELLHQFSTDAFVIDAITLTPDNSMVIAADDHQLWCWRLADDTLVWHVPQTDAAGTSLLCMRDGRHIFTCGRSSRIEGRSVATGALEIAFDEEIGPAATALALGPGDRTLAYTRNDATLVAARNPFWTVGDIDGDGCVNLSDLGQLLADYGRVDEPARTDLTEDGRTNLADLGLMLSNYGACD